MVVGSPKILVVDDIKDWRITIRGVLQDAGYLVDNAGSVNDAVTLLEKNQYVAALLDIRLDETDEDNIAGLELAKTIKKKWSDMKIVIITGYGTPTMMKMALEPGASRQRLVDDYLPKENTDKLIETVRRILA